MGRIGWLMLIVIGLLGHPVPAGAGDDMWQTLRDAGKSPAQIEAEKMAERRKELERQRDSAHERSTRKKAAAAAANSAVSASPSSAQPAPGVREKPGKTFADEPVLPVPDMAEKIGPCYHAIQRQQYDVIAGMLERRLLSDRSLTNAERKEMREDAQAARKAAKSADKYTELPTRVYTRLTPQELEQLGREAVGFTDQNMRDCGEEPLPGKNP